jgi:uncharacterized protein (DUF4415 family)
MQNDKDTFTLSDGSAVADLTNWKKFDALTDEQVVAAAKADPDAQPATDAELEKFRRLSQIAGGHFLDRVRVLSKENKIALNVRYDADIVNFFKGQGKGYQRLMNNVLRAYMESRQEAGGESQHA